MHNTFLKRTPYYSASNVQRLMTISPPDSESALLSRARALAGKTIGELSHTIALSPPQTLHRHKGWVGMLLEQLLGAHATNQDQPDFLDLGIELKTLPLSRGQIPAESTYICALSIPNDDLAFETSRVWRKLAKILWIPIEHDLKKPIAQRRIGAPLLWTPPSAIKNQLRQDWEELIELVTLGHWEKLNAHLGHYLQIRPKAAHSRIQRRVIDEQGQLAVTVPRGFYLRCCLTKEIIKTYYALPSA